MRAHTTVERRRLYLQGRLVIARHHARPLTLPDVARALATSPRQLQRAFAQAGGLSFSEQLIAARLDAAARLLLDQPLPVAEVARRVGYHQPSHFARAFRRRHGLGPAEFRRVMREARRGPIPRAGVVG